MKRTLSFLMALVLLLAGCGGPGGASSSQRAPGGASSSQQAPEGSGGAQSAPVQVEPSRMVLAQPVYPDFPQQPQFPEEGGEEAWDAFNKAYNEYYDALDALRGDVPWPTDGEQSAVNAFASKSTPLALAGHEGENAVYSPLSLWSAMAMLAQCAGGDSRQQVLDALGADSVDSLQEQVSHIWQTLYTDDGLSSMILADSIWLNSAMEGTYVQDTLDTLAQKYYAAAYAVPMGTGEADQAITDWVKEQTNGLIGGGAPVVQTDPETLALLASSLYYRAAWVDEFNADRTEEDIFTSADGKESKVDFMHKTKDLAGFLRRKGWQAAYLSTQLGEMVFVLPDKGVSPESLLKDPKFLSSLHFSPYSDGYISGKVEWSVPKFDVDSDLELKEALAAMGVIDLLDENKADLSALTDLDAFLSDAKQLARVKVNEEGVEAAAATMMGAGAGMPPEDPEICVMDLDRPFLFVIEYSGIPLFVGVVNQVQ